MDEPTPRSYATLTTEHLAHLAKIANPDWRGFTDRHPDYKGRYLGTVLAQGAAQHYLDCVNGLPENRRHGVKDIDVWTFFAALQDDDGRNLPFPANRRRETADFGPSDLGRQAYSSTDESKIQPGTLARYRTYTGRRIDLMLRATPVPPGTPLDEALAVWLTGTSDSARFLAQRPIIGLAHKPWLGKILHTPPR